ncbi:hypothetical protein KL86CLO1_11355 [uncultured Eubacteriales bacterium]|uniref:Uncharacterized protein n=1 Tax=uncultured Eubacteriales bacterium TaxID=172733 RepID=A0A212JM67_9FIRM|nr:hypothetical protein KL86CLO1_11355 [uncultured Eubacteriales bacterium]
MIQHSVNTVAGGESLATQTAKILQNAAEKSQLVEQAIQEIAAASSAQAQAIEQINHGLAQVSAIMQTNAASAEESSASSQELAAQAQTLRQEVGKFKLNKDSSDDITCIEKFVEPHTEIVKSPYR